MDRFEGFVEHHRTAAAPPIFRGPHPGLGGAKDDDVTKFDGERVDVGDWVWFRQAEGTLCVVNGSCVGCLEPSAASSPRFLTLTLFGCDQLESVRGPMYILLTAGGLPT